MTKVRAKKNDIKKQEKPDESVSHLSAEKPLHTEIDAVKVDALEKIRASVFFDEAWYKGNYKDLKNLNIDFALHYLNYGWRQGKSPSFGFSGDLYLVANPDVKLIDTNPLLHYETYGKAEKRYVLSYAVEAIYKSEYFDDRYYQKTYSTQSTSRLASALDYLMCNESLRNPSEHFNADAYLKSYPDVDENGVMPLLHFELHGKNENRTAGVSNPLAKFLTYENNNNISNDTKRVCLFACYMGDGLIPDETVFLLEKVRTVCDAIVLIGDCGIKPDELLKIEHLVCYAHFIRHREYDFGSYKRAFAYADENGLLKNADEILICNDSVVGPCGDINDFFKRREEDGSPEFYGTTINNFGFRNTESHGNSLYSPHIQSYFLSIAKSIFDTPFWRDFIYSVKHEDHKTDIIINYEMGMSKLLASHGHTPNSMYKSIAGLNPAARECLEVLNTALFIKKSMLPGLSPERAGIVNGIFKSKGFPFHLKENRIFSNAVESTRLPLKDQRLKIIDSAMSGNMAILLVASEYGYTDLELIVSNDSEFVSTKATARTQAGMDIHGGISDSYLNQGLHLFTFEFDKRHIEKNAELTFSNQGTPIDLQYIYGDIPCYNLLNHKKAGLYPRIEKNILHLQEKEQSIISIMLSDSYSQADKALYASIINNEKNAKYSLYSERASLTGDNAYEAFKYALKSDDSCFYITSNEVISREKDEHIKKHLIPLGSARHKELFLNAKALFCSFGFPGIIFPGLKDIHISALSYKLYLMWHGISAGDKNSYEIASYNGNRNDGIFACSTYEENNFSLLGHDRIYLTGYPRMDKWCNDVKLDANSAILFFTWRRTLYEATLAEFLNSDYVAIITELVKSIAKKRPTLNLYYFIHNSIPAQHVECLAAILRAHSKNIRFVNNDDTHTFNHIFNTSQYLITDYSSVGYDFAYYKKRAPLFFMPANFINGHYTTTELFDKIIPGAKCSTIESVIKSLHPGEYKKHKSSTKAFFRFMDAENCRRSHDIINTVTESTV
ncbi:CDP-glycerol glycerophosphotransferase family protein [Pseudomonas syringae]|uniref:CDP-glycerol glycerophosphotransferase family protein n=1 Tax=Pseudomonas syringae TaxID=317 RepID=UPI000F0008C2|nr:CDP-glycerol glycerophosphotransferase family protein [Pseudomonas syringae]RMS23709.1 hypothetical protein ALP69_02859 [Pseudomonas syringae pv. aceris]